MTIVNVGVIGVGLLGSAVAERLLAGGFKVAGYDPSPAGVEALAGKGLRKAGSVAAFILAKPCSKSSSSPIFIAMYIQPHLFEFQCNIKFNTKE